MLDQAINYTGHDVITTVTDNVYCLSQRFWLQFWSKPRMTLLD